MQISGLFDRISSFQISANRPQQPSTAGDECRGDFSAGAVQLQGREIGVGQQQTH
jgi:hypothetical protein